MGISGIGGGIYDFNSIRLNNIPVVQTDDGSVKKIGLNSTLDNQDSQALTEQQQPSNYQDRTVNTKDAVETASYALSADKSLIGSDSDIESLDIQKAISNMKKDSILQEYSFFVQDVNSLTGINTEDGSVVRKTR